MDLRAEVGEWRPLSEQLYHHLIRVLRLSEGEQIELRDGAGGRREGRLEQRDKIWGVVLEGELLLQHDTRRELWLLPALFKAQRFDWLLEKAAELGVNHIQPVLSQRAVVRWAPAKLASKLARCERVLSAGARQSGGLDLTTIAAPLAIPAALAKAHAAGLELVYGDPKAREPFADLNDELEQGRGLAFISGPEGGFEEAELGQLDALGARGIRLTSTVLRAETAPLAFAAALRLTESRSEKKGAGD